MKIQKQFSKTLKRAGITQTRFASQLDSSPQYVRMVLKDMDGEAEKPITVTGKVIQIREAVDAIIEKYKHLLEEVEV